MGTGSKGGQHHIRPAPTHGMSLRLRQAIAGRPSAHSRQTLGVLNTTDKSSWIVYPSASNVVLLTPDLDLADTLPFWSAFPHRAASSSTQEVAGIHVDSPHSLIIAWSGAHVALWQHISSTSRTGWNVHSSIVASQSITCIDFCNGVLACGAKTGVEVWRYDTDADVVVWDRLWDRPHLSATSLVISPILSHLAWCSEGQKSVFVLTLDRKAEAVGMSQELRHPREISWIAWRKSGSASGDAHLYTITSNSVFRIYAPVLDDPAWFQLLSTLEGAAFSAANHGGGKRKGKRVASGFTAFDAIWPVDATVFRNAANAQVAKAREEGRGVSAKVAKMVEALGDEEGDVIMSMGWDGILEMRSIVNIDRKPPTLLKSLQLARVPIPASTLNGGKWTSDVQILHVSSNSSLLAVSPCHLPGSWIQTFEMSILDLLATSPSGFTRKKHPSNDEEVMDVQLSSPINHFVRTPNGRGLLAVGDTGEIGVWYKERLGKVPRVAPVPKALVGKGQWIETSIPQASAIFAKGRAIVFYAKTDAGGRITLQHLDDDVSKPTPPIPLPGFSMDKDDEVKMLLAVSDIDDGYSGRGRRTQRALIMAASRCGYAWVWRVESKFSSTISTDSSIIDDQPEMSLLSHYLLPVESGEPHLILPVDPMGWHQSVIDWKANCPLQDMVLTVSADGVLEFWSPELGHQCESGKPHNETAHRHENLHVKSDDGMLPWRRTGVVRTGRKEALIARCSSRKKTVLICQNTDGSQEMTIWDSKVSEFSTGLELTQVFEEEETIQDLDWTTTSDLQSVLAVGFPHKVVLVCEQRMSYVESTPGWAPFVTINLEQYTSVPISDSIWLAGGSFVVGAGNQVYVFSRFLDRDSPAPSPAASARSVAMYNDEPEDIFQLIALQNGPLWDYHPTVLSQCLLWDKIDLVKAVLVDLVRCLQECEEKGRKRLAFKRLDPLDFFSVKTAKASILAARKYDSLFDSGPSADVIDNEEFNSRLVTDLIARLDSPVFVPLTHFEKSLLATIAQATLEVERERRSLDICGLRYLISIRMVVHQDRRSGLSGSATPVSKSASAIPNAINGVSSANGLNGASHVNGALGMKPANTRLSFRNFVWAMHSESHDLLLSAATDCCENKKMLWNDAKRLGVFLWLKSSDTVKSQLEIIARNRFMVDEDRDPTTCSLIFFALGKKKVVHGLWRQAPGHREQLMTLKFLANDFELERWKAAAVKNAYALLSKQRYEYAAAFFMLGGCPRDAVTVCLRQLNDWQLGFALARTVENGTDGPLVRWILTDTVIPLAMRGGHRWLATWAFWILGKRDLAVRVLISPMTDVASVWSADKPLLVGNPENDDPSLLLLFQHLKAKSLQTAKGTSEIPEKTEFDFVLHNARVFFRMGCHSLALDLLHSWSFVRPFFPPPKPKSRIASPVPGTPSTPLSIESSSTRTGRLSLVTAGSGSYLRPSPRRNSFMLSAHGRHESMVMDMDVLAEAVSEPSSRVASPPQVTEGERIKELNGVHGDGEDEVDGKQEGERASGDGGGGASGGSVAQPQKIGNLMKELKQDVRQGAMEFDMDSFFQ